MEQPAAKPEAERGSAGPHLGLVKPVIPKCDFCGQDIEGADDFERSANLIAHVCDKSAHKSTPDRGSYCGAPRQRPDGKYNRFEYNWKRVTCPACLVFKTDHDKRRSFLYQAATARKKKNEEKQIGTITAPSHALFSAQCSNCWRSEPVENPTSGAPKGWGVFTMLFKVQGSGSPLRVGGRKANTGMGQKIKSHYLCPTCLVDVGMQKKCGIKEFMDEHSKEATP